MPEQRPRHGSASPSLALPDPDLATAFAARRTAALGSLAGGISHDLANPIGAVLAFASYLASDPRLPADLRDDARLLRAEAEKTHRLVRTLLEFARDRAPSVTAVDVGELLDEALELAAYALAEVTVARPGATGLPPVEADPSRLRHLLLVLLVDAISALGPRPARGHLVVDATSAAGGVRVVLEARPSADVEAGSVAGIARDAIAGAASSLGGTLDIDRAGDVTRLVLDLPTASAPSATSPLADVPAPSREADGTNGDAPDASHGDARRPVVLVCDDEDAIRQLLVRLLERAGFEVVTVPTGEAALDVLAGTSVDVVLTDQQLGESTGIELYERATSVRPPLRTRFVLMSGDPHAEELVDFAAATGIEILPKPFDMHAVASTVARVAAR